MIKMKIQHTSEQIEMLKLFWLEWFDDELKEKRDYQNDYEKTWWENEKEKIKLRNNSYDEKEKEKLQKFERKLLTSISHGYFLEIKDIYESL